MHIVSSGTIERQGPHPAGTSHNARNEVTPCNRTALAGSPCTSPTPSRVVSHQRTHLSIPKPPAPNPKQFTSTVQAGTEAQRLFRIRKTIDKLTIACAICWALGLDFHTHSLDNCPLGLGNGRDGAYKDFRISLEFEEGVCWGCGMLQTVTFAAVFENVI